MVVEFPGQIQLLLFFVFLGGGGVYDDICDCFVFAVHCHIHVIHDSIWHNCIMTNHLSFDLCCTINSTRLCQGWSL